MKGWRDLKRFIQNGGLAGEKIVIGLDFDGTLSPFVRRPARARLPEEIRRLLHKLARRPRVRLAIVSGRSLADIKARVRSRKIYFSGNHGLEIQGTGLTWRHPKAGAAGVDVRGLNRDLSRISMRLPGVLLENKGLTLSVHYREMDAENRLALRKLLARSLKPYAGRLMLASGKKVWDIRPSADWNKGHALLKIAHSLWKDPVLLFVGDDLTDEEGFRVLGRQAVTIRVGPADRSAARFCLSGRRQVRPLLSLLYRSLA